MKNYLEKLNKGTLKQISIIIFVVSITLIIGGSLATFNFDTLFEGFITNKLSTCKLSLNVKDDNPITLVEAYPISDEKAKEYTPYTFTITNKSGCDIAYYKITLGDICNTCSKTNDICTVNGQSLNCSDSYKLNSSKIKYELVNKKTNEVIKDVNPENIEVKGQIVKNETINFELKLWIDSSATNEDLYVYENGKPKENSDGTIVTKNVGYKLSVEGQDTEFKSIPNPPLLTDNMIPVYYDESDNNWKKADVNNSNGSYKWYDYDSKMWANAVTVSNTNRSTYLSANAGTTIPMSDINAMFVWIPRYKYTYFASVDPVEIPITFEKGTASTGTIKCMDAIVASSDKSEVCTDTTNGSLIVGKSTYTHPVFTFGDEELTGIWVGKFENSGGNNITIKPDVQSTRSINVSTMFQYARNMELANNIYGFPQTGSTLNKYTGEISGDNNNLDTHMMRNMEWGAVTYFTYSKYGLNSEVYINNSEGYYTGRSGGNVGGSTPIKGAYTDQTSTSNYNTYGFYTYDGYLLNYNTNEKSNTRKLNKVASTTGNIYGVYDMSGGAFEYVMGNMQDSSNQFYRAEAGTWSTTNKPLDKYYDKYSYGASDVGYTRGKLGDATIEMGPNNYGTWYSDNAYFLFSFYSWFGRGSAYYDDSFAGLFGFGDHDGGSYSSYGSRVVLSISFNK